ncbi:MAG: hypothetical protein ACK5KL_14795 [Dysgonomonas sp.]
MAKKSPDKNLTTGKNRGETLYTIYCPKCKSMNVWQLKRSDPAPNEGDCDPCGIALFDENGKCITDIEVDLI